jgi:hypothetical protein
MIPSQSAPLYVDNNHLLASPSPGPWIIDTGSPGSISSVCPTLPIRGILHAIPSEYRGVTIDQVNAWSGTRCYGLLGNDILCQHHVTLDLTPRRGGCVIIFEDKQRYTPDKAERVPIDMQHGVPILQAHLGDAPRSVVFDTGAQISYVANPAWLTGEPIGKRMDFMMGYGQFQVDVYRLRVRLGSVQAELDFAHHPAVNTKLQALKADGIIGWEILKHGPALYSLGNKELWI